MGELVCSNTLCHFAQVSEHMNTWRVGLVCRIGSKCKTCKSTLHQPDALYCQGCAYSKVGLCCRPLVSAQARLCSSWPHAMSGEVLVSLRNMMLLLITCAYLCRESAHSAERRSSTRRSTGSLSEASALALWGSVCSTVCTLRCRMCMCATCNSLATVRPADFHDSG